MTDVYLSLNMCCVTSSVKRYPGYKGCHRFPDEWQPRSSGFQLLM